MIWMDYAFIAIVLLSMMVGVFRGLVREAFSLAVWVLAFVLTLRFAPLLAESLKSSIHIPAARTAAAYAMLFFGVLIVGALITWAACLLIRSIGLGGVDRMLGGGFGLARGIFIITALVLLGGSSAAREEAAWKQSILVPQLKPLADGLHHLIPEQWLAYLQPRESQPLIPVSRPES